MFAASITEELTKLNNLYKEGAITEEEFSKAKSILLKTKSSKEQSKTKKVNKKEKSKKLDQKTKPKEKKIIAKKTETNEDLTETYMHINELQELGNFVAITEAPEGMFKTKSEHFSPKVKEAQQKIYLTFVQNKGLMEKYPENLFKAMGYFEFFYMDQLRQKKRILRNLKKHIQTYQNISKKI